jgi:demethylmenaquinone methyltransferase/2-methoxy-6-polyprenyl-1,4-benzoquinol methylase
VTSGDTALTRICRRYERVASFYDRGIGERLLYAAARARAVELLRLPPGATVLDVACGTGLNFPLIEERIGACGRLVGIDLTPGMLRRAAARVQRAGWSNVTLVELDAARLSRPRLEQAGAIPAGTAVDAALCTLGLTVIPEWELAWEAMLAVVRSGGAIAVMDGDYPQRPGMAGKAAILRPFAWLIYRLAAADRSRAPWQRIEEDMAQLQTERFTWGYVRVAAGRAIPCR